MVDVYNVFGRFSDGVCGVIHCCPENEGDQLPGIIHRSCTFPDVLHWKLSGTGEGMTGLPIGPGPGKNDHLIEPGFNQVSTILISRSVPSGPLSRVPAT